MGDHDWSFIVGAEVTMIGLATHGVHLCLSKDIDIEVNCEFEHRRLGKPLSDEFRMCIRGTTLVSLLGKTVQAASSESDGGLCLHFEGETLTLPISPRHTESFVVSGAGTVIVV